MFFSLFKSVFMNILERINAPTPDFFKRLRNFGLALAAISAAILAAPVVLPIALVTAAGYAAVGGAVISAVSQITTNRETPTPNP